MESLNHLHNIDRHSQPRLHKKLQKDIRQVVKAAPLFIFPNKSHVSAAVAGHYVLQSMQNAWFRKAFADRGWEVEFSLEEWKRPNTEKEKTWTVDFAIKVGDQYCMVEVEFGNRARLDSDLTKLVDAHYWGRLAFGVVITSTQAMASVTTGGAADYEQALGYLSRRHPRTYPLPLQVVGLKLTDAKIVDLSQSKILNPKLFSGISKQVVLDHVVAQYDAGVPLSEIGLPENCPPRIRAINVLRAIKK